MLNDDVLQEFIFDCRLRKLSERTIKGYRNNMLRFFRYLETEYNITKLNHVKANVIKDYINYLAQLGRKETYINSIIKGMRAFFLYCEKEEYIVRNPMNKVNFQKENQTLIVTFSDEEVEKMVRYYNGSRFLDVRNKLIMILLFDTGVRNFELCNLRMTDIRDTYIFVRGKGKKDRVVPITPIIKKQLIKYKRVRNIYIKDKFAYQTEYLLLSQKGKKLTPETTERIVKECGCACNVSEEIRISPHTCRHYYAQSQLRNGCDLYTLSRLLGHSNLNITKIYLRSINKDYLLDNAVATSPLMNL